MVLTLSQLIHNQYNYVLKLVWSTSLNIIRKSLLKDEIAQNCGRVSVLTSQIFPKQDLKSIIWYAF